MAQDQSEIVVTPGGSLAIGRGSLDGWQIGNVNVNGVAKSIYFTNSVDLIDWLSSVLLRSDGGNQSNG